MHLPILKGKKHLNKHFSKGNAAMAKIQLTRCTNHYMLTRAVFTWWPNRKQARCLKIRRYLHELQYTQTWKYDIAIKKTERCRKMIKSSGGDRLLPCESQLHQLLDSWPWASSLTSLNFYFFHLKVFARIKGNYPCEALSVSCIAHNEC